MVTDTWTFGGAEPGRLGPSTEPQEGTGTGTLVILCLACYKQELTKEKGVTLSAAPAAGRPAQGTLRGLPGCLRTPSRTFQRGHFLAVRLQGAGAAVSHGWPGAGGSQERKAESSERHLVGGGRGGEGGLSGSGGVGPSFLGSCFEIMNKRGVQSLGEKERSQWPEHNSLCCALCQRQVGNSEGSPGSSLALPR